MVPLKEILLLYKMKIPFASISYFLGSAIFFIGATWYIIDALSVVIPYLGFACACCYMTASTIQLIVDLRAKKPVQDPT